MTDSTFHVAQPTLESIRKMAQERADFWLDQAGKNESRASHYEVISGQFQKIADALAAQPPAAPVDGEKAARDYEHGYNDGVEWAQTHGRCSAGSDALRDQAFKTAEVLEAPDVAFDMNYRQFLAKQLRDAMADVPQTAPDLSKVLESCKGEHLKFEEWAAGQKYDMTEHPLHYLFTDTKTYHARQGWKAALCYVAEATAVTRPQSGGAA